MAVLGAEQVPSAVLELGTELARATREAREAEAAGVAGVVESKSV